MDGMLASWESMFDLDSYFGGLRHGLGVWVKLFGVKGCRPLFVGKCPHGDSGTNECVCICVCYIRQLFMW